MKIRETLSKRSAKIGLFIGCVFVVVLVAVLIFVFKPCEHQWLEATCNAPKTCSLCNEIEGQPLKHKWKDATCETAVTCELCGEVAGKALGHQWQDATCKAPQICSVCNKTQGEKLDHKWNKATCTKPQTCSLCKETKGKKAGHKWESATYEKPKTCSVCGKTSGSVLVQNDTTYNDDDNDNDYEEVARCPICGNQASRSETTYCSSHDCSQTDCPYPAKSNGAGARGSFCDFHGCQTPRCLNIPIGGSSYCASCQ